eukprot:TRINITY_DN12854_c0_g1_i1.p1 TRINITY_DN12854_c0_g1~~TRINITY_DN12854_c0_g1_i1.p1  ORF type:complete len:523 (-),score=111.15 TRINITY_DN12854_c0_g1_i1:29-1393(-)
MKAVVPIVGQPYWSPCEVRLADHIFEHNLTSSDTNAEFLEFASAQASVRLPIDKPLWQIHIMHNYDCGTHPGIRRSSGNTGTALFYRIHHCIGDGVGLMQALLSMTDRLPAQPVDPKSIIPTHPRVRKAKHVSPAAQSSLPTTESEASPADEVSLPPAPAPVAPPVPPPAPKTTVSNAPVQASLFHRLSGLLKFVVRVLGLPFEAIWAVLKLVFMRADSPTGLNGTLSGKKRMAWSPLYPLEEIKQLSKPLGVTINDVAVAACSGALRTYLGERNKPVSDGATVRSVIPFNLHTLEGPTRPLHNEFSLLYLPLPLQIGESKDRISHVNKSMLGMKSGMEPLVNFWTMKLLTWLLPVWLMQPIFEYFSHKASIIMTNVPGPAAPLLFAHHQIESVFAWVPQSGSVGLGLSIISYGGTLRFGLQSDDAIIPDPAAVIALIHRELMALRAGQLRPKL